MKKMVEILAVLLLFNLFIGIVIRSLMREDGRAPHNCEDWTAVVAPFASFPSFSYPIHLNAHCIYAFSHRNPNPLSIYHLLFIHFALTTQPLSFILLLQPSFYLSSHFFLTTKTSFHFPIQTTNNLFKNPPTKFTSFDLAHKLFSQKAQ